MKNVTDFKEFQNKKRNLTAINENVIDLGKEFAIRWEAIVPKSLISSYLKKVKDESGKDMGEQYGDMEVGEKIVNYLLTSYMNIENLPTSILLGVASSSQVQPKAQAQETPAAQTQEPVAQTQEPAAQNVQAQSTANEVPSTEGGTQTPAQTQSTAQGSAQTTAQTQTQKTQA